RVVRMVCNSSACGERAPLRSQPSVEQAYETVAVSGRDSSLGPRFPNMFSNGPRGVHWSYQKLIVCPLPSFGRINLEAKSRKDSRDIQDDDTVFFPSILHKISPLILYS